MDSTSHSQPLLWSHCLSEGRSRRTHIQSVPWTLPHFHDRNQTATTHCTIHGASGQLVGLHDCCNQSKRIPLLTLTQLETRWEKTSVLVGTLLWVWSARVPRVVARKNTSGHSRPRGASSTEISYAIARNQSEITEICLEIRNQGLENPVQIRKSARNLSREIRKSSRNHEKHPLFV